MLRLVLLIGAFALAAGVADARILPFGAKPAKGADEPICTTTTTVVKRGAVVLSTTSSTQCEAVHSQAAPLGDAGPAPAPGSAASPSPSPSPFPSALGTSENLAYRLLFGAGSEGMKPRDVLGIWSALEPGQSNACTLRLTREAFADGYRVITDGCRGELGRAKAWRFEETKAGLYDAGGAPVAKLVGDKQHLVGLTIGGKTIDLSR